MISHVVKDSAPALLGYFLRRVDIPEDAADLVAQTVEAAVRSMRKMPEDQHRARLWLFGIARNILQHHHRSIRRHDALVQRLAQTIRDSHVVDDGERMDVRRAVSELPEDLGELIRLVHWDGFSIDDAARLLNVNPSTARSRHARAKDLLRAKLSPAPANMQAPESKVT
ncbi:RNA polymerase sigma-70 factor (ECF subfamily) [Microbacterium sp. AK009]|uniref:RNA polymerase sigma factor n=1 Tax=Microbacterium sp. AK009 TaxID=2723068 RepID=UPI0015CD4635|nr:sigma-70 family RNA polymerase sigma factor [Microbacterium sp. AK009]NYF18557.1 RNA polymerase sigma-70 factor (ECF subfamily) [Microbacterium sp. AK009]